MPILKTQMDQLIFIDESHFISLDQWKDHGWYKKGSYALAFRQNLFQKQSCSLLLAISCAGNMHHMTKAHRKNKGVKAPDFLEFMLHLHRIVDHKYVFVMDNARVHKSKMMKMYFDAMKRDGRCILFQAKYSPELNPIELVFGFLKRRLKIHPQIPLDLIQNLEFTMKSLTAQDCANTIHHIFDSVQDLNDEEEENQPELFIGN